MGSPLNLWMKTAFLAIVLMSTSFAMAGAADRGQPGALIVGFRGSSDAEEILGSHGLRMERTLAGGSMAVVLASDTAAAMRALARHPAIAFVTPDQPLRLDASSWDASSWDASSWDASSWDASSWDASSWDASTWDASTWDASTWDASTWDASTWDASTWDASTWDASTWDASTWDASTWDASTWDANGTPDAGYDVQWGLGAANVTGAWATTYGTGAVTICVLDTGVDHTHPDLQVNLLRDANGAYGYNAMNGTTYVMDDVGHGTHVTGLLAATGANGIGITGIARSKVLSVKVMGPSGGSESDLIAGIDHCIERGAKVASMSLHVDAHDAALESAIGRAQAAGMLLVASAGNDASATVRYPAAYAGVLSVGAVTPNGTLAGFSNHGAGLDLVAPGHRIASTAMGGGYKVASGTSQAVPFVAGAAALMWEKDSQLTSSQVSSLLTGTARDLGASGFDGTFGHGALDAGAAVSAA